MVVDLAAVADASDVEPSDVSVCSAEPPVSGGSSLESPLTETSGQMSLSVPLK